MAIEENQWVGYCMKCHTSIETNDEWQEHPRTCSARRDSMMKHPSALSSIEGEGLGDGKPAGNLHVVQ